MTRWPGPIAVAAALLCTALTPAPGQQVPPGWRHASTLATTDECDACHTSHVRGSGGHTLKGEAGGSRVEAWLQMQAPGAGDQTIVCLRCHWTGQGRAQAPELGAAPQQRGTFLGPDLADDHPLGSTDPTTPRLQDGRTAWMTPSRTMSDRDVIECTTCHDPHTPGAAAPRGAELQRLCTGCHPTEGAPRDGHRAVSCTGCHQLHDARQPPFLRETTVELMCTRCHPLAGGPQAGRVWNQAPGDEIPLTVSSSHNPGSNCLECHTLHRPR